MGARGCEVPCGACNLRPLFFIFSCFLLFIFTPLTPCPALPCPALPRPYPALPCPYPALAPALPCFEFSFCCQGQEEEITQGTDSVFFSFCCQGQEEEVTPCPARQTDRHVAFIYKILIMHIDNVISQDSVQGRPGWTSTYTGTFTFLSGTI